MHRRFVLALLLALLLESATAASSNMEGITLPVPAMDPRYPSPDGIFIGICDICHYSICACSLVNVPRRAPTFTADTFLGHPEWLQLPSDPANTLPDLEFSPELDAAEPERDMRLTPYANTDTFPPLFEETVEQLNANATTVQRNTVQVHVDNIYTPGYPPRIPPERRRSPHKRPSHKRQPPRPGGGFPCKTQGCGKTFDRACELNRHKKVHLGRDKRPHKCEICNKGFLYPKDCQRHQRTHDPPSSQQTIFYCRIPGCKKADGFSRHDNLLRHQRMKHSNMITPADL